MTPEQKVEFAIVQTTILRIAAELTHGITLTGDKEPLEMFLDEFHSRYGRAIGTATSTVNIYNELVEDGKVLAIGGCFVDEKNEGTDKDASWYYHVVRIACEVVESYVHTNAKTEITHAAGPVLSEILERIKMTPIDSDIVYTPEDAELSAEGLLAVFYSNASAKGIPDAGSVISTTVHEYEVDVYIEGTEGAIATLPAALLVSWVRNNAVK